MFVVSRVVSTVYMCGLDLSGLWQKIQSQRPLPISFCFSHLKTEATSLAKANFSPGLTATWPKCKVYSIST